MMKRRGRWKLVVSIVELAVDDVWRVPNCFPTLRTQIRMLFMFRLREI